MEAGNFKTYVSFSPSCHDEGVVDGDADDLIDAGSLQLVGFLDVA